MPTKPNRVGEAEISIPALLAARDEPGGVISTSKLISVLSETVPLTAEDEAILDGRQDTRFSQIVRNIKSHKGTPGNLIYEGYEGYFEAVKGGFRITAAGRLHLKNKNL
jgi:hypothetical protein